MPAAAPQLLLNGTLGIAVGMATNIPPHNLREVIDATAYLIDNKDATTEDLLQFVQGPDFPLGALFLTIKIFIMPMPLAGEELWRGALPKLWKTTCLPVGKETLLK